MPQVEQTEILDCGHPPSPHSDFTTGYGYDENDKKHCYACCAERDKQAMIETGKATLYLVDAQANRGPNDAPWRIQNWPGSLSIPVWHVNKSRHNIAGKRYDAWFNGPDGFVWHGTQYGNNTQLIHCKRTKEKTK